MANISPLPTNHTEYEYEQSNVGWLAKNFEEGHWTVGVSGPGYGTPEQWPNLPRFDENSHWDILSVEIDKDKWEDSLVVLQFPNTDYQIQVSIDEIGYWRYDTELKDIPESV